jgi:hypothetical protein
VRSTRLAGSSGSAASAHDTWGGVRSVWWIVCPLGRHASTASRRSSSVTLDRKLRSLGSSERSSSVGSVSPIEFTTVRARISTSVRNHSVSIRSTYGTAIQAPTDSATSTGSAKRQNSVPSISGSGRGRKGRIRALTAEVRESRRHGAGKRRARAGP